MNLLLAIFSLYLNLMLHNYLCLLYFNFFIIFSNFLKRSIYYPKTCFLDTDYYHLPQKAEISPKVAFLFLLQHLQFVPKIHKSMIFLSFYLNLEFNSNSLKNVVIIAVLIFKSWLIFLYQLLFQFLDLFESLTLNFMINYSYIYNEFKNFIFIINMFKTINYYYYY